MKKIPKILLLACAAVCTVFGSVTLLPPPAKFEPLPAPVPSATPSPEPTPTPTPEPTPTPIPRLEVETGEIMNWFTSSVTGQTMEYYVSVPANAVENMPLIVFLHGDGYVGMPENLVYCGVMTATREIYGGDAPYIVLCPATKEFSWTDNRIPETLRDLIDAIAVTYSCDVSRISIAGHSRGSIGVWTMVSLNPGYFSAAVPISCGSMGFTPENFADTPVRAFIGDDYESDFGRYGQDMQNHVDCLKLAGVDAELTVLPDCTHGAADARTFTRELIEWMIAQ